MGAGPWVGAAITLGVNGGVGALSGLTVYGGSGLVAGAQLTVIGATDAVLTGGVNGVASSTFEAALGLLGVTAALGAPAEIIAAAHTGLLGLGATIANASLLQSNSGK